MADLITVEEAAEHLRVDASDPVLPAMIAAAVGHLDGPDGYLGRALTPQTIQRRFPVFPRRLPYPPVIEVTKVEHYPAGAWSVVDAAHYELVEGELAAKTGFTLPYSFDWRITWRAGYDGEEGRVVPPALRAAILLMIGDLYANRESREVSVSTTADRLLGPFKVYR
jgi:hypothetical protein